MNENDSASAGHGTETARARPGAAACRDTETVGDVARLLRGFAPNAEGPVTVVFGTFKYRSVIDRWLTHAERAGCRHYRIVCMDDDLLAWLRPRAGRECAVSYYSLFPDTPRVDIDSLPDRRVRLRTLTPLRARLFRRLVDTGCDFIHSDADAFWLRDPRPWLERHVEFDLLYSQGGMRPVKQYRAHRFVLCAGFFLARANERTRALFATVDARTNDYPSDQIRVNHALLEDPERVWTVDDARLAFRVGRSRWFRVPLGRAPNGAVGRALVRGAGKEGTERKHASAGGRLGQGGRRLGIPGRRRDRRVRGLLQAFGEWGARRLSRRLDMYPPRQVACIVTSEDVIRGQFGAGLTVGVIPMSVVERVRIEPVPPGYLERLAVSHTTANKAPLPHDHGRVLTPIPRIWARLNGSLSRVRRGRANVATVDGSGVREALGLSAGAEEPIVVVVGTYRNRTSVCAGSGTHGAPAARPTGLSAPIMRWGPFSRTASTSTGRSRSKIWWRARGSRQLVPLHRGYDRLKINHLRSVPTSPTPSQPVKITVQRY